MARYLATADSPRPVADVFATLSDFSTVQDWDPGVAEARRLEPGPVVVGSAFRVVTQLLGVKTPLTYVVTAIDAPATVTLRAESATLVSLDTMTFTTRPGGGTRVTYDADLTLKGPLRLGDLALRLVFRCIGDRARDGLRAYLAG
jgi:carbon monoxide dehydrogenase subunit G